VVDSSDKEKFEEFIEVMEIILEDETLKPVTVLILANKQDLKESYSPSELIDALKLKKIKQNWSIYPCVAITGEGLLQGLDHMRNIQSKQ
jgi:signal recognition particle receptor subunit beta